MSYPTRALIFCLAAILSATLCAAQDAPDRPLTDRVNLLFGLNQPLVGGFNVEGNLFYKRLAFDYSHGVSLDLEGATLSGAAADQQLALHLPYTTGFGVGYRFNDWLNVRAEPKWHGFEVYREGAEQTAENLIVAYSTFSVGVGAYASWRPFSGRTDFLSGLMVAPSVRYWPRVSSSLADDSYEYFNEVTERTETHEAQQVGLANTPWVVNVSIGYSLRFDGVPRSR